MYVSIGPTQFGTARYHDDTPPPSIHIQFVRPGILGGKWPVGRIETSILSLSLSRAVHDWGGRLSLPPLRTE